MHNHREPCRCKCGCECLAMVTDIPLVKGKNIRTGKQIRFCLNPECFSHYI